MNRDYLLIEQRTTEWQGGCQYSRGGTQATVLSPQYCTRTRL
jgi:hypothetical protein